MRILCGCVVSFSVLLSSFLGSAAWSQSGTSEPPGLDEIIAAANSYVQASPSWTPAEAPEGSGPESDEGGNSDVLDSKQVYYQMPRRVKRFLLLLMIVSILVVFLLQYSTSLQAFAQSILQRIM